MIVRFHKGSDAHVLTCIRPDGSHTWNRFTGPTRAMITHDLLHYAVETTLGWRDAFYGLVAAGWDITTFTVRGQTKLLPPEALHAEFIVGLLQTEMLGGGWEQPDDEAFLQTLHRACGNAKVQQPTLASDQLRAIRACARELFARWQGLPSGQSMDLDFG